jgi:hypothetical protein
MNKDDLISALIQEEDMLTPGRILVSALGSSLEDHLKECILEGDIEKTGIPSLKISRESMDVLESAVSGSKLETAMRVYRAHKDRFDTKIRHQLSPTQLRISDPQLLTKVTDCYNVVAEEQKRITIKIDDGYSENIVNTT